MVGYRRSRKARLGQQHALYVREQQERLELCLGIGDGPPERLWIRISIQTNEDHVVMDICYGCLIRKK